MAGARRREQGAVGQCAECAAGKGVRQSCACESAHPGDTGVRVGRLERVHSSGGRAAAGLAAACAAQPAESWPPLQRSTVQAGNLRAESGFAFVFGSLFRGPLLETPTAEPDVEVGTKPTRRKPLIGRRKDGSPS